ncbi:MAG: uracil-DNA glycosylase family protein [Opitutaceae bacterium]|nr:uracil-DNA glycosylase family protein [Opitutaceae bacterium]
MRASLQALTDELRRLKSTGVRTIAVSDESIAALRKVIAAGPAAAAAVAASARFTPHEPVPSATREPAASEPPARENATPAAAPTFVKPASAPAGAKLPPAPTVQLPAGDKQTRWTVLHELVVKDATCCARVRPGKKVVLGVGSLEAKIMFVGEAPGAEEEIKGEPFVGPAGQLLTRMIQAMGLKREDVYIGNIMNWRPDMPTAPGGEQIGNRPPNEDEMRYCLPYLRAQIEVVNPELLVALGSTAAQGLLGFGSFKALGDIRGKWHEFSGKPLMVTYHPSYILRNQSNRSKRMIWEDLLKVMERSGLPISEKQRGYFLG